MFSVVVITYNQEKYISQTLDSILNQEHNYPYEIVVGEDCSTDNTKRIIEEYVKKYPEIIKPIYNNPNLGLIKNYFNTLSHCSGKYIMECAGDDYWLPGKVKTQIEFMEKNPDVGMCYGKAKVWNDGKCKFDRSNFWIKKESFNELIQGNDIPAPSVCLRKYIVQKYIEEISPVSKEWAMEDYPMWLYISYESEIKFLNVTTACYRILENSASHSVDIEKQLKFSNNCYLIQKYFADKFNYSVPNYNNEQNKYCILFEAFLRTNDKKYVIEMRKEYKNIKEKSFKIKLINKLSGIPTLLYFLMKIRRCG